jgi:hemin uptake protein HemP
MPLNDTESEGELAPEDGSPNSLWPDSQPGDRARSEHCPASELLENADRFSLPIVDFLALSQGQREVMVRHDGQWYRLRLTRNNRLILQK